MWYENSINLTDMPTCYRYFAEIERMLALPEDSITDVIMDIEFGISKYIPCTFHSEAEGGDISEVQISNVAIYTDHPEVSENPIIGENLIPKFQKYLPDGDDYYYALATSKK